MLPATAHSNINLRVIHGKLWCCCGLSGIVIFDTVLRQQRTIPGRSDQEYIWDVTETIHDEVVISAHTGLWTCVAPHYGEKLLSLVYDRK